MVEFDNKTQETQQQEKHQAGKVSLDGVSEGDFTLVYGFPGRTNEYLPAVALSQIEEAEIDRFLLVSLTLAVISVARFEIAGHGIPYVGDYVNATLDYLKFLILPGTLLVALKLGYKLLKD